MNDSIRAAVAAAELRGQHGRNAYVNERLDVEIVPEIQPDPPAPKPPTDQPTPVAATHPDVQPAPHGGGTAPPDSTSGLEVARIVERIQAGAPSMTGYRDRPAVVNNPRR